MLGIHHVQRVARALRRIHRLQRHRHRLFEPADAAVHQRAAEQGFSEQVGAVQALECGHGLRGDFHQATDIVAVHRSKPDVHVGLGPGRAVAGGRGLAQRLLGVSHGLLRLGQVDLYARQQIERAQAVGGRRVGRQLRLQALCLDVRGGRVVVGEPAHFDSAGASIVERPRGQVAQALANNRPQANKPWGRHCPACRRQPTVTSRCSGWCRSAGR
jgi:hypothetical protein